MVIDMKVTVYSCREFDEKELFIQYGGEMGIELVLFQDAPCMLLTPSPGFLSTYNLEYSCAP